LLVAWRLEASTLGNYVGELVSGLKNGCLIGYLLFILAIAAWYWHASIMRKNFSAEYKRIGREKSNLQNKASKHKFNSSAIVTI